MSSTLTQLAESGQIDQLESAWKDALNDPGPTRVFTSAIHALCDSEHSGKALALATEAMEALAARGRQNDAVAVGMVAVERRAHNEAMTRRLWEILSEVHGGNDWFKQIARRAHIDEGSLTPEGFLRLDHLLRFTKGNVLYHAAGWGEGVVEDLDAGTQELKIRFASGRVMDLPLDSAIDTLTPLDDDDLRTMLLKDPESLKAIAAENPTELIRKVAKMYRGKAASTKVKDALVPAVIMKSKWTSWWKKARAAAALDPWLQAEGNANRPTFVLRKKPLSLRDEMQKSLDHTVADGLGKQIEVCRDYLERAANEDAKQTVLELARERIEKAIAANEAGNDPHEHAHVLDGILLLEQHDLTTDKDVAAEVRKMLLGEDGSFRPTAFDDLATQEAREHAVELIDAALGDGWAGTCIEHITEFPDSVLEPLVNRLQAKGHARELLTLWERVSPYPARHPLLLYLLGKLYAEGAFDEFDDRPSVIAVGRVMLHLARTLAADRGAAQPVKVRVRNRLTTLLAGRKALLKRCFEEITKEDLKSYLGISERGGQDFPQEILDLVLRFVAREHPDLTAKPEKPFWEEDRIWTTREGLERQKEVYRKLVEEKIPENSKAIGAAASLGDLSENSEWDAAMEEQRNLTARANEINENLKKARLLDDAQVPEDTVAPGTAVTVKRPNGDVRTYRILGPWDADEASRTVNYKAPLAEALLGCKVGDTATLTTTDGEVDVTIEAIEKIV